MTLLTRNVNVKAVNVVTFRRRRLGYLKVYHFRSAKFLKKLNLWRIYPLRNGFVRNGFLNRIDPDVDTPSLACRHFMEYQISRLESSFVNVIDG